jgi:AAA domain-containing protein
VAGDPLGHLQSSSVLKKIRDPCCPKGMGRECIRQTGVFKPAFEHSGCIDSGRLAAPELSRLAGRSRKEWCVWPISKTRFLQLECLITAKKQWAEQQLKAVAKTSVYKLITKWCELAEQVEYAVVLEGASRRGKTYACENYCRAYPHKFRFLATPDEPSFTAMLDALFQAIGIEESSTSSNAHKRRKLISEALQYSGITYIFDEAQFLFPPALKEGTTPQRLNFFRRIFMDTPQSVVLICTPQTLAKSSKRLRKIAKYETDQWDGRILGAPISLPDEFTEKELAEVMQLHLPEVDPGIPSYVAMIFRSMQEYRLSKIVSIAKLARSFAMDEGQSVPKLSHVDSAIKIVLSDRGAPPPD